MKKYTWSKTLVFFVISFFSLQETCATSITVNSDITANTTWNVDTVLITGDFTVLDGVTLTIDTNTYIEFQGYYLFEIKGQVIAKGNKKYPVIFTINDTTDHELFGVQTGGFQHILIKDVSNANDGSVFEHCIFLKAKTTDGVGGENIDNNGGALYIENSPDVLISNCLFDSCYSAGNGGAIYVRNSFVEINESKFEYCISWYHGGAVALEQAEVNSAVNTYDNNYSFEFGGAVFADTATYLALFDKYHDNFAENSLKIYGGGGATCLRQTNFSVNNCRFINNIAFPNNTNSSTGGGLFASGTPAYAQVKNCLVSNNQADRGGGIHIEYISSCQVINTTVVNNYSDLADEEGVVSDAAFVDLYNCIIWNNAASTIFSGTMNRFFTNEQGGPSTGTNGNIDLAPLFIHPISTIGWADQEAYDAYWGLRYNSPCINAGTVDTTGLELFEVDLEWNPRIQYGRIDMGAYETTPYIYINEVDANTPGTDNMEFIELYDGGIGDFPLDGLVFVHYNGSTNDVIFDIDLDGYKTDSNGFFVLGNAGVPGVDYIISDGELQNGPDAVALYLGNGTDFVGGGPLTTDSLIDALVYNPDGSFDPELQPLLLDGPQIKEGYTGDGSLESMQRVRDGKGGLRITHRYFNYPPTPGMENGPSVTSIHQIQGTGLTSPHAGQKHSVRGTVIGDFQDTNQLRGFFIQEEDWDTDDDSLSSEAIFVFDNGFGVDVKVGNEVLVSGTVQEYNNQTQIYQVTHVIVGDTNQPLPIRVKVFFPLPSVDHLERYENMQIDIVDIMTVTDVYPLGRFGTYKVSQGGRLWAPTNVEEPGINATNLRLSYDLHSLLIDDGSMVQNPDPVIFPPPELMAGNSLRCGNEISGIKGILTYSNSGIAGTESYRVHPTKQPNYNLALNSRAIDPFVPIGNLMIGSFNLENYFTSFGSRGAENITEFTRQKQKTASLLSRLNADVIGLVEIENNPTTSIADLVQAVNDSMGYAAYNFINTGIVGSDEIRNAIIFKPDSVTPVGPFKILDGVAPFNVNTRPPVAQAFRDNNTGNIFLVVVNHLKSRYCAGGETGANANTGDEQECYNGDRILASQEIVNWINSDADLSIHENVVLLGDYNAYLKEDPVDVFRWNGYTCLPDSFTGMPEQYSYVFKGMAGALDYGFVSDSLEKFVTGYSVWHTNSDEPVSLDYNLNFKNASQQAKFYNGDPFRSSDHDPLLIGINFPDNKPRIIVDTVQQVTCNGGSDGAILTSVVNGTPPYSYLWSSGQTTEDISGIAIGTYKLVVTDNIGLKDSVTLNVAQPTALGATVDSVPVNCFGGTTGSINISGQTGGSGTYHYSIDSGFSWLSTSNFTGLSTGYYDVMIRDANATSCAVLLKNNLEITQPGALTLTSTTVSNVSCQGGNDGSIQITVSGGTPPYTYNWSNGGTTEDITGLYAGNYTLNISDANSCTGSFGPFTVTEPGSSLSISESHNNPTCPGNSDGAINIMVSGGTPGYSYTWNTSDITKDLTNVGAGIYEVTVVDANGCTEISPSIMLVDPPQMILSATASNESCPGSNDGSIDLTVTNGTSPFIYAWSSGNTTQDPTGLASGSYQVTVTDSDGCIEAAGPWDVFSDPSITTTAAITGETCPGSNNGAIDVTISNGTSPFTINWDSGQTTEDISGIGAGTYTITISDVNGCKDTNMFNVATINTAPLVFVSSNSPLCEGDTLELSETGGDASSWNWTGPGGYTGFGATPVRQSVIQADSGWYKAIITDLSGCQASDSVFVAVSENNMVVTASASSPVCEGDTLFLDETGGMGTNWLWTGPNGFTSSQKSPSIPWATLGIHDGTYSVTALGSGGCQGTSNITVNITSPPSASITGTSPICQREVATLTASGGTSYTWSTGETSSAISVSPDTTTRYSVTVTDGGCTDSANFILNVTPSPFVDVGGDSTICSGTGAILTTGRLRMTDHFDFWEDQSSHGFTTSTTPARGAYSCGQDSSLRIGNCDMGKWAEVTMNVLPNADDIVLSWRIAYDGSNPTAEVYIDGSLVGNLPGQSCSFQDMVLTGMLPHTSDGQVTIRILDNTSGCGGDPQISHLRVFSGNASPTATVNWSSIPSGFSSSKDFVFVNPPSDRTFIASITENGCTSSDTINLTVASPPIADAGADDTLTCAIPQLNLDGTGSSAGANIEYNWTGPGIINGATTTNPLVNMPGGYRLSVRNTITKCRASDSVQVISSVTPPVAYAGLDDTLTCNITSLNLDGSASSTGPEFTYQWFGPGIISGGNSVNPVVDQPGWYSLLVTNTLTSCDAIDSVYVDEVLNIPVAFAGNDTTICQGDNVTLTATGGTGYSWNTGATSAIITVSPVSNTTYYVTVTNNDGCTDSASVSVTVSPAPVADAGSDTIICEGDGILLTATGGANYSWNTGHNHDTLTVFPTTPTTYYVTVSNGSCTDSASVFVDLKPIPLADAGTNQTICEGDTAILSATGGSLYTWSTGSASANITVVPIATTKYIVTVTDNGCTDTSSVVVNVSPRPTANAGPDTGICHGESTTLKASGGVIYNWSTGATTDTTTVSPTTDFRYHVTVSDGLCQDTSSVLVKVYPVPVASAGSNQTICEGETATLTASGGASYSWNTGESASSITVTPISTSIYHVTVTENGCTDSASVTVNVNPLPVAFAGKDVTICEGDSTLLVATGGITYEWDTGEANDSIHVQPANTITYFVTVTENGCSDTDSVTVSVNEQPSATFAGDLNICSGESANLQVNLVGTAPWDITYSDGMNFFTVPGINTNNYTLVTNPTSTITYTITTVSDVLCSGTGSSSATVTVNNLPNVSYTGDTSICEGDSSVIRVNFTGTGPWEFSYTAGAFTGTETGINSNPYNWVVSPGITTTYNMTTISDANCTNNTAVATGVTITVNPLPKLSIGPDTSICQGEQVILDPGLGNTVSYLWSDNSTNPTLAVNASGVYSLTITDGTGCEGEDKMTLNVDLPATVNSGNDTSICQNASGFGLSGSISGGSSTGIWSTNGTGVFSPNASDLNAMYSLSNNDASVTSLSFVLTSTNNGSCPVVSDTFTLSFKPAPTAMAGNDTTICLDSMGIQLNGAVLNTSGGTWSTNGDGAFSPSSTNLLAVYKPGPNDILNAGFTLNLSPDASGGCTGTPDSLIITLENPVVNFDHGPACSGSPVSFTDMSGLSSTDVSDWLWTIDGNNFTTQNIAGYTFPAEATYTASLTITLISGCSGSITKDIIVSPKPVADFTADATCGAVNLENNSTVGTGNINSYNWTFSNGFTSNEMNPVYETNQADSITINLVVETAVGCLDTAIQSVNSLAVPTANFTIAGDDFNINEVIQFTDESNSAVSWNWHFGDQTGGSTDQNPVYSYVEFGQFEVVLEVRSEDGCADNTMQTLLIESNIALPNAFSPNGDDQNDVFRVLGGPFTNMKLQVYNKWGKLVFESNDQETGWDGKKAGVEQPEGVYVYVLTLTNVDGEEEQLTGNVTLLR